MGIEFVNLTEEMIEALSISGPAVADRPYWKVVKVEIQPQTDNQSAWVIAPEGHFPNLLWSTGEAVMPWKGPDAYAPPGARQGAYSQPLFNCWGNYGVIMEANSEAVRGLGLYGDPPDLNIKHTAHHPVLVYFQLVQPGPAPEPPPVTPPAPEPVPEPDPIPSTPYEFGKALSARLVAAGLGKLVDVRDAIEQKYARLAECGVRSVDADKRLAGFWSITFHHDAIKAPLDVMAIAKDHTQNRGWPHIAYHFIIDKAGTVWWVKRLKYYSAHSGNARFNKYSIPVTAHGDFTSESPSEAQFKALKCVTDTLEEWVGEHQGKPQPLPIVRHKDIVNTACPGSLYETYIRWRRL